MKWVLGIIAVIVLAIYGYVRLHVYSQTFQFRMTMTVSTPEGEKSASSVIAVYLPGKLGGSPAYGYLSRHDIRYRADTRSWTLWDSHCRTHWLRPWRYVSEADVTNWNC